MWSNFLRIQSFWFIFLYTFPLNSKIKVGLKGSSIGGSQSREPRAEKVAHPKTEWWILNQSMSVGRFSAAAFSLMGKLKVSINVVSIGELALYNVLYNHRHILLRYGGRTSTKIVHTSDEQCYCLLKSIRIWNFSRVNFSCACDDVNRNMQSTPCSKYCFGK